MTSFDSVRRAHSLLVQNCFYPLVTCSLLSLSFLAARFAFTDSTRYRFLVWNLFLAWVPYGCAVTLAHVRGEGEGTRRKRRGFTRGAVALLGISWLLTFPNAPYILTDVVHLMRGSVFRWWFDAGLVLSFALTGYVLAACSLRIMHDMVRPAFGELIGWVFVTAVACLSGFGIYLGRFLRFNSWDVVVEPARVTRAVFAPILDPFDHSRAVGVTLMFAAIVLAFYVVFTSMRGPGSRADTSKRIVA